MRISPKSFLILNSDIQDDEFSLNLDNIEIERVDQYKYLSYQITEDGNMFDQVKCRLINAQKIQALLLNKITVGKGLTPRNAALLIKSVFNQIFAYGLEIVPICTEHLGKDLME